MQGGATDSLAMEPRSWAKPFRPVWWWLVFSVVLLSWDYHRRHAPLTHVDFRARVEGKEIPLTTRLDGTIRRLDFVVPLGRHSVTLEAPDVEPWRTNLFVWYGRNDLGDIPLRWQRGTLALQVQPIAEPLELRGPHYQTVLKGSAGLTSSVPVGKYEITPQRGRYLLRREVTVTAGTTSEASLRFEYGGVSFSTDPPGAVIQNVAGERLGETPLILAEVKPGHRKGFHKSSRVPEGRLNRRVTTGRSISGNPP